MYSQEERADYQSGQKDLLFQEQQFFTQDQFAGFWLRFAAYLIDAIAVFVIIFLLSMVFGIRMFFNDYSEPNGVFIGFMGAVYLFVFLYFPIMESSSWQATVGKRAVGILVTDLDGNRISFLKALGRTFGKILSGLIIYIGYIMVAFTDKKQGLHDILAGTLVIRGNR